MKEIYKRFCPECNKIILYKNIKSFKYACKNNFVCRSCSKIGSRHPNFGKSPWNKGKKNSQIPWHKGKTNVYSKETLEKMSAAKKGRKLSLEIRQKMSKSHLNKRIGIKMSEDSKKKMRIFAAEAFLKTKKPRRIDGGFDIWIKNKNKEGYNFVSDFYLNELGYFVDGYDKEKHIIVEYDTEYHNSLYQHRKDLYRQNKIIEYFKNKGNPLNEFWRINALDNEKLIIIK